MASDPDSDPDSDPEGAAMAAAMGFSSFGGKKPAAKKRKFNPSTDAFVEGDALEKLDRGGKKGTGSGGNTIPLGKTRTIGVKSEAQPPGAKANDDEIALDDKEEEEEDHPEVVETARRKPVRVSVERSLRGSSESSGGDGPRYMDTSEVAPVVTQGADREAVHVGATGAAAGVEDVVSDAEKAEMQRRIDAILASMDSAPPPPSNDVERPYASSVTPGAMPPPHATLPSRAAFGTSPDATLMQGAAGGGRGGKGRAGSEAGSSWGGRSEAGSSRGGGRQRGGRGGQREGRWYEEYYDPAFNTNPWEALEKAKGLKPVGSWLEYSGGQRA
ncbi:uncharacterized protein L3040_008080 [Drepanopeziza brunnea f. sp. 'multigermtubi']|uniref:Uncharacterized protein n=1 Tax=Marssonina brunnea f. sp. multigermtubi (strain MB_m1) TaxID=1072389 RepID=K1XAL3_MARBU|nr:uncharacterized protein MBM_04102 [Drepanopeziza brunnea f. sp. 'multigermtubi' MB_m1]EKD17733.1 hypothetical protein MBM_04102 [Drepanopeziza brunnea f. sp. 'multigermtubi' MB_m1]KAJ5035615.1 hypothetical protein L3040_008080 [Drepanopeziza brunnea f. sp. 'multigermtubi']